MAWTNLCALDELKEGLGRYVAVGELQLAVFLYGGEPYVMNNRCPHAGGSLSGGTAENGEAICPWHQWAFGLETGQLRHRPMVRVRTYPARVVEGERPTVQADLPKSGRE